MTRCTHLHVCGPCSRQPPERKGRHLGAARMKRSRGTRVWEGTYPSTISIALAGMVRKNVAAVGGAMAGLVEEEITTSPLTACLSETSFAGWRALSRGPHSLRSPAIPWTRKETHGVVFPLADTGCKIRQCSGAHLHSHQLCVAVRGATCDNSFTFISTHDERCCWEHSAPMSATTVPHRLSRWWCQSAGLASLCVALRGAASRLAVADALRLLSAVRPNLSVYLQFQHQRCALRPRIRLQWRQHTCTPAL